MNSWYSMQDVLKDFAAVTRVPADFDDYIVRGEKPPPKRPNNDDDDEFELRFGKMNPGQAEIIMPDLDGITEMLRMVQRNDMSSPTNDLERHSSEPVTHVISKLNPHVQEFVPKSAQTSNSNSVSDKSKNENISENVEKSDDKCSDDNNNEKMKQEALLKEKIKVTSKTKTLKDRTEKNVAIAALIKLNSMPQSSQASASTISCSSSPKPMILYTPEYFENNPASTPITSKAVSSTNKYSNDPIVQESIQKVNNWFEKPVTTTDFVKESLKDKSEIEESTKKLVPTAMKDKSEIEESAKKLVLKSKCMLEPFSYRRKDKSSISSVKSPLSESVKEDSRMGMERDQQENATISDMSQPAEQAPSRSINSYKPSPFAAELLEKYRANQKTEQIDMDAINNIKIVQKGKKRQKNILSYGLNFRGI